MKRQTYDYQYYFTGSATPFLIADLPSATDSKFVVPFINASGGNYAEMAAGVAQAHKSGGKIYFTMTRFTSNSEYTALVFAEFMA